MRKGGYIMQELINSIPTGQENAIHLETLCKKWGCSSQKAKKLIRAARFEGMKICSGKDGYWIARSNIEGELFINGLRKQGYERLKTARAVNNSFKDVKRRTGTNSKGTRNRRK